MLEAQAAAKMARPSPIRLLLVEDNPDDAMLVRRQIERAGLWVECERVDTAEDMARALAAEPWDAVVSDIRMPRFDGLEALKLAGDHDPDLPVIMVSGQVGEEAAAAAMRAGARDFVVKTNLARLAPALIREIDETEVRRQRHLAERALRESEERYRAVVEVQSDMVSRFRPDTTALTFANRALLERADFGLEGLAGQCFVDLFMVDERKALCDLLADLSPSLPRVVGELRLAVTGDPDQPVWTEWSFTGVFDDGGRLLEVQGVGRDISERRRAVEAERQQLLLVEVLRDTAAALNSTLVVDEVFDRILAAIAWVVPHDASAVLLLEGVSVLVARARGWGNGGFESLPRRFEVTEREQEALLTVLRGGQLVAIEDAINDPNWDSGRPGLEWVRSLAAAPLFFDEQVGGVLMVLSQHHLRFTPTHLELLKGFASQAATAARNARLFDTVSRHREELRALSHRLVEAQEDERRHLALELHDEVGQALTAITMHADQLRTAHRVIDPEVVEERLRDISEVARSVIQQVRGLCLRLRPAMLDELGLVPTLSWYAEAFAKRSEIAVDLVVDGLGDDRRLPPAVEIAVYRAAQEALTNAARHSGASEVTLELAAVEPDRIRLVVTDDGSGIKPRLTMQAGSEGGLGLIGIRERVEILGGRMQVESGPRRGATIEIEIPIGPPSS